MSEYWRVPDPEDLIECPYDKVHMIRAKRFPYHLLKCKKNYIGSEFAVCPFNARHEMPKPELRYHMANCPDRARLEKDLAYEASLRNEDGSLFKGCTDVPAYRSNIEMNENWDHALPMSVRIGVHPNFFDKCQYKNLTGYTPAQKREFYQSLKDEHDGVAPKPVEKPPNIKDVVNRLRMPHKTSEAFKLMPTMSTAIPKPPDNIFMYSLSMAGIGRGRGVSSSSSPQRDVTKPGHPTGIGQQGLLGIGRGLQVRSTIPKDPTTTAILKLFSSEDAKKLFSQLLFVQNGDICGQNKIHQRLVLASFIHFINCGHDLHDDGPKSSRFCLLNPFHLFEIISGTKVCPCRVVANFYIFYVSR